MRYIHIQNASNLTDISDDPASANGSAHVDKQDIAVRLGNLDNDIAYSKHTQPARRLPESVMYP